MFTDNFIKVYDHALSKKECDIIIETFETELSRGDRIYKSDSNNDDWGTAVKKAYNLPLSFREMRDRIYHEIILNALHKKSNKFCDQYPYLNEKTNDAWGVNSGYNIQKYEDGDGFYTVHCENGRHTPYRVLAWMIYLNDAKSGTEFPYYNKTIRAKKGRLVLWPSQWTHIHKGVTPNVGVKYIATGWYGYVPPDPIFEVDVFSADVYDNVITY